MTLSIEFNYPGKPEPEEEKKDDRIVVLKPGERPEDAAVWLRLRRKWIPVRNKLLLMIRATKDETKKMTDTDPTHES
jgi:hypothetical protein